MCPAADSARKISNLGGLVPVGGTAVVQQREVHHVGERRRRRPRRPRRPGCGRRPRPRTGARRPGPSRRTRRRRRGRACRRRSAGRCRSCRRPGSPVIAAVRPVAPGDRRRPPRAWCAARPRSGAEITCRVGAASVGVTFPSGPTIALTRCGCTHDAVVGDRRVDRGHLQRGDRDAVPIGIDPWLSRSSWPAAGPARPTRPAGPRRSLSPRPNVRWYA